MKTDGSKQIPALLSVSETAERFGVTTRTVRRWIKDRGLRIYRPGGGRLIRISVTDSLTFLNNSLVGTRPPISTKDEASQEIPRLLSVSDAAKRCGVRPKTVRSWIKHRGLRIYRPGGGRMIRIAETDLLSFLNKLPTLDSH